MLNRWASLFALLPLACAGPGPARTSPEGDPSSLRSEVIALRDDLARLANRVGHLESEIVASREDGEFRRMTIDRVEWSEVPFTLEQRTNIAKEWVLLCHVEEWDGFGRMKRFTRMADSVFYLEADGHPRVEARMGQGGISSDDGSTRYTMLSASWRLTPGVEYTLRPRNEADGYNWVVKEAVRVSAVENGS
jgi:hypothetical protein